MDGRLLFNRRRNHRGHFLLRNPTASTGIIPSVTQNHHFYQLGSATRTFLSRSKESKQENNGINLGMEKLYQSWTLEDDRLLLKNSEEPIPVLASMLGRGLSGVRKRLEKLQDVESDAYQRLFSCEIDEDGKREKLVPASEVLRRIEFDYVLNGQDFSILHYDRVEDEIVESPFNAPNESISGKAELLVKALPEHRIVAVKYKERIVWDRENRKDYVFSNEGIYKVIDSYEEWKRNRDDAQNLAVQRQEEIANHVRMMLGVERFKELKEFSKDLQRMSKDETVSIKMEIEKYVQKSIKLFSDAREDPSQSMDASKIPMSDYSAIEEISALISTLPDEDLRLKILSELEIRQKIAEGKKANIERPSELPELNESDLEEKFVRGSGAGGQKINKTSNRVVLLHVPTQIRVECQDTRSLHQNRKIARKRLQLKLDEHYNGSQSKASIQAEKAALKKSRAKNRNKARQKKKRMKEAEE